MKTYRPRSYEEFTHARWRSIQSQESERIEWVEEEVLGPDVEDRETLLTLAKMTYNSYIDRKGTTWYDLGKDWNVVRSSGYIDYTNFHKLSSHTPLAGNLMPTVFEVMYSQRQITRR